MNNEQKEWLFNECVAYLKEKQRENMNFYKKENGKCYYEALGAYNALRDVIFKFGLTEEYKEYTKKNGV